MAWEPAAIKAEQASGLALLLALAGLALVYFWPTQSAYLVSSPDSLALMPDGQWVQVSGQVASASAKTGGYSLRLCQMGDGCVTVSVGAAQALAYRADGLPPAIGTGLTAQGEIASLYSNKFIRADKIVDG